MIGLRADEWDMILGGLEAFRANEKDWLTDTDPNIRSGAQETIDKLDKLDEKVRLIEKTMRYFEKEMAK